MKNRRLYAVLKPLYVDGSPNKHWMLEEKQWLNEMLSIARQSTNIFQGIPIIAPPTIIKIEVTP